MIPRDIESALRELLDGFPVVTLTGPRQSGKRLHAERLHTITTSGYDT